MKAKQIAVAVSTVALALAATTSTAASGTDSRVRVGDENDASWIYVPARTQARATPTVRVQKGTARQIDENGTTSSYVTQQN